MFFCKPCIQGHLNDLAHNLEKLTCPVCATELSLDQFVSTEENEKVANSIDVDIKHESKMDIDEVISPNTYGSKIVALVDQLKITLAADPTNKIIVFSQWAGVIEMIAKALKMVKIHYLVLEGRKKDQAIQDFRTNPLSRIMLMTMKNGSGAAGLTLTIANYCYIMDPTIHIGLEDQAIARLHRIGQKRNVSVIRLIIRGSVEEKLREIQNRKRAQMYAQKGTTLITKFTPVDDSDNLSFNDICEILNINPERRQMLIDQQKRNIPFL